MSYQITVQPSGRQFAAEADETLLDAALRQGLTLPHGCRMVHVVLAKAR